MPGAGGLLLETRSWQSGSGSERPLRKSRKLLRATEGPPRWSDRSLRRSDGLLLKSEGILMKSKSLIPLNGV